MLKKYYDHSGLFIIAFLAAIPLFFWFGLDPLAARIDGMPSVLRSLGQICGLTGAALMSLNIILATRLPVLERFFPGLNAVYQWHHRIGAAAFILLLVHPVLLAYSLIPLSLEYAYLLLIPSFSLADLPLAYGRTALFLMAVILVMTFYLRPRYHIWKMSHRFLGVALLLAFLHVFFITSDVSRSPALKYYLLVLITLGLMAGFYRALKGRQGGAPFLVKAVRALPGAVTEIEIAALGPKLAYESGQFVFVIFEDPALGRESHPFSLSSAPDEPTIRIAAKSSGDYTAKLRRLTAGTKARIEGPFGRFNYNDIPAKRQIWIAGGIGITPFLGMARQLSRSTHDLSVDFFYTVRRKEDAVYLEELKGLANGKFRVVPHISGEQGRLTAAVILEKIRDWKDCEILICGPVPMMRDLKKQLAAAGVLKNRIHNEEFEL